MDLFTYTETRQPVSPIVNCEDHARAHAEIVFRDLWMLRGSKTIQAHRGLPRIHDNAERRADRVAATAEYVASGAKMIGWPKREWIVTFDAAFSGLVIGDSQKRVA